MAKTKRFRSRRSRVTLAVVSIVVLALVAFFVYRGSPATPRRGHLHDRDRSEDDPHLLHRRHRQYRTARYRVRDSFDLRGGERSVLEIGDTVKKGQVLFTLVDPQLDVAVAEAQNAYDKAILAVDSANWTLVAEDQSGQRLQPRHTASQVKQATASVANAELAIKSAENAVKSAEIALQEAKDDADARTVTAPWQGDHRPLGREWRQQAGGPGSAATAIITDPDVYEATDHPRRVGHQLRSRSDRRRCSLSTLSPTHSVRAGDPGRHGGTNDSGRRLV